ncbi:hypothetical protein MF672_010700 [Actinomadura sp. ATCC 31491]|uniref:Uncharacterized protein n=1 Tax=Actinomadura luzonensis TaxID=2805427 RepID=A0ABT0FPH8_9ACTN|nr:hypothetical protein [Actinomadura luzonensis]MCK2214255.1 hypothetical protein [Actinomadura luzonensis]
MMARRRRPAETRPGRRRMPVRVWLARARARARTAWHDGYRSLTSWT